MACTKLEIENRIGCTHIHFNKQMNAAFCRNSAYIYIYSTFNMEHKHTSTRFASEDIGHAR